MNVLLGSLATSHSAFDAVAIPVAAGEQGAREAAPYGEVFGIAGVDLPALLASQTFAAEPGDLLGCPLASDGPRLLLAVGIGDGTPAAWRKAGAAVARRVNDCRVVGLPADAVPSAGALSALAEGLVLASYRYRVAGAAPKGSTVERFELLSGTEGAPGEDPGRATEAESGVDPGRAADGECNSEPGAEDNSPEARQAALQSALAGARATLRARDLTNTPSMVKTPQWLAEQAAALAGPAGLRVRVWDERALAADGFGGILAVGSGSIRPPRLIELNYHPAGAARHVVLVGKGITFDSGGLSIKPNDSMVSMKTDMAGGAAVLAVMAELTASGVAVRVTGVIPAAENMPSGTAQRPGDVIRHYGGRTSEVLNTDAEGRLVLADALAYADAVLEPDVVVDIATLTGAAPLGLGRRHAALYATTDALAAELAEAAARTGERVWRMPLVSQYRFAIDSRIADVANTSTNLKISGGSITAALFLREFTGGRSWAHLDIAGPARADGDEHEVTKGATGYGARLLLRWLQDMP